MKEYRAQFISVAVHESNWQEGIELDIGMTRHLASMAFDDLEDIAGPHLDMNKILRHHRHDVIRLKSKKSTPQEIGAFNLARAHHVLEWIHWEMTCRVFAILSSAATMMKSVFEEPDTENKINKEGLQLIEQIKDKLSSAMHSLDRIPLIAPMTSLPKGYREVVSKLEVMSADELSKPVFGEYIQFLHKLLMMGVIHPSKGGKYRRISVHVGNPDVVFPPPLTVPQLMAEYCAKFSQMHSRIGQDNDVILTAAMLSHKFVSIHPFEDGNGRISRLIMNLVLWGQLPPVYLKADKKGRHRYAYALKRADRGNFEPYGALIAMSLIESYEKMLRSMGADELDE